MGCWDLVAGVALLEHLEEEPGLRLFHVPPSRVTQTMPRVLGWMLGWDRTEDREQHGDEDGAAADDEEEERR
eukprot:1349739-Rhodomonas_salina.2